MAVKLSPFGPKPHFEDSNGDPLSGGLLYFYGAGGSTAQDTYTTSAGSVANANPIVLNSRGEPANQIWFTEGLSYKATLKTSAGVEIWTSDNLRGINDTSTTIDEWIAGTTPTYISATSFSVTTDQSSAYHVGRRLKSTNTGGTIYSTVTAVSYTTVTTVTVANDSGSLDSGMSAVWYGINSANGNSVGSDAIYKKASVVASAATTNIWATAGDYLHITGTTTITSLGTAPYAGACKTVIFDGVLTLTHNATTLLCPGGRSILTAANDRAVVRADTTANMVIVDFIPAGGNVPPGSITDFAGSSLPGGWLECDGAAVSRTTYAGLFAAISTNWGTGDGSTTFNLPDFRGRARVGKGTGTLAETVAAASVSTGNDTFAVTSNNTKWITGMAVVLTTTGGLPAGLSLATTYYVVRDSSTTIKFASSLANAQNGTVIDITTQGTGSHTVTHTLTARSLAELGGEEGHAMSSTELLSHTHVITTDNQGNGGGTGHFVTGGASTDLTNARGGNASMNVMQPFAVTMTIIKY